MRSARRDAVPGSTPGRRRYVEAIDTAYCDRQQKIQPGTGRLHQGAEVAGPEFRSKERLLATSEDRDGRAAYQVEPLDVPRTVKGSALRFLDAAPSYHAPYSFNNCTRRVVGIDMVGGAGKPPSPKMREISVGRMRVVKISQVFRVGALIALVGVADTIFGAKSDNSGAIVRSGSTPTEASICRWDIGAGHMSVRASRPLASISSMPANGRTRATQRICRAECHGCVRNGWAKAEWITDRE